VLATLAVQRLPGEQSLGRYAVAVPTEHGLPGIWHAPLLSDPQCVAALRRANAPFLLIGGHRGPVAEWRAGPHAHWIAAVR
jgi:hypothetical protein